MRRLLLSAVLAPYAVGKVAAVVMWRFLFDLEAGQVSHVLLALGLPALDWGVNPTHGLVLVWLLSVWLHLPFTFMIPSAHSARLPCDRKHWC